VIAIVAVLIGGALLHGTISLITHTPGDQKIPLRWKTWHSFLSGLGSGVLVLVMIVACKLSTGNVPPLWATFLAMDLVSAMWRLLQHYNRIQERRALENLLNGPSFGDEA
jgi:hypothetical protein